MWDKIKKFMGYAWASPVTACGLAYAGLFNVLGWYSWYGVSGHGLVWRVNDSAPSWLKKLWMDWNGHAIGNVVVLNCDPIEKPVALAHELVHVRQCMRLGVFDPIVYGVAWLGIKFGCESSSPYWTNPLEIDARRTVGQLVDVEGAIMKAKAKGNKQ